MATKETLAVYHDVTELEQTLSQRLDKSLITEREGAGHKMFSYVPWTDTVRLLNKVFGPFGWTTTPPHSYFANGTYNVEFGLTVRARDGQGNIIEKTVPASGQAIARGENDDNALKSAQSDAISRGSKLLGDAFGFYLYEEKAPQTPAARPAVKGTVTGPAANSKYPNGLSVKQLGVLTKNGVPEAAALEMPFKEWKPIVDSIFAGTYEGYQSEDDIPF